MKKFLFSTVGLIIAFVVGVLAADKIKPLIDKFLKKK